jgi:hypothetical protein
VTGRWLLLRRLGLLWAVPSGAVRAIRREVGGAAVELADSTWLQADELLEMTPALRPRQLPSCVAAAGAGVAGLAVWDGAPVAVLAAGAAPPALLLGSEGTRAGGGDAPPAGEA